MIEINGCHAIEIKEKKSISYGINQPRFNKDFSVEVLRCLPDIENHKLSAEIIDNIDSDFDFNVMAIVVYTLSMS